MMYMISPDVYYFCGLFENAQVSTFHFWIRQTGIVNNTGYLV